MTKVVYSEAISFIVTGTGAKDVMYNVNNFSREWISKQSYMQKASHKVEYLINKNTYYSLCLEGDFLSSIRK